MADAKRIFLFLKVLLLSFFSVALSKYFTWLSAVDLLLILFIFKGALILLCYNFAKLFAIGGETRIESSLKNWATALCSKRQEVLLLGWIFSTTFVPGRTGVLSLWQQQHDFRCCRAVCLLPALMSVELFGPSGDAWSELGGGFFYF